MSNNVFCVTTERRLRLERSIATNRSKQKRQCANIVTTAAALTPQAMAERPDDALKTLIELQRLVERQMTALSKTAFDAWRSAALTFFGPALSGPYSMALIDPPWEYASQGVVCATKAHYSSMSDEALMRMPVRGLMHEDSVIALWVTAPKMDVGIRLLAAWGYEFKSVILTWCKVSGYDQRPLYGQGGAYTKPCAEYLLLGQRGNMHVMQRDDFNIESILTTRRSYHSRKPECVRAMLVRIIGDRRRCELFARETDIGWDAWGNEVGKFDNETADDPTAAVPLQPGSSRVNNLSAVKATHDYTLLPLGRRDRPTIEISEYHNRPFECLSMSKLDYVRLGETPEDDDELYRVVDIRSYATSAPEAGENERHPTYTTLTIGEARQNEALIRRVQQHNDEVLYALNNNKKPKRDYVQYSDPDIAVDDAEARPDKRRSVVCDIGNTDECDDI